MPSRNSRGPAPLADADLSRVEAVFTDVDGTLTTKGKLTSQTLAALERLARARIPVVLVSGRPSGWGEAWIRQWPVDGAILENGGLHYVWRGRKLIKSYAEPEGGRQRARAELIEHVQAALDHVKGAQLSSDSAATEVDLAIDYAEDVSLGAAAAGRLERFLAKRGVTAVRSSVHVNCWMGDFDKRSAVARFASEEWGTRLAARDRRYVFVGDSFNDAPLFGALSLSIGVANVRDVLHRLESPPRYITPSREGQGFEEVAEAIIRSRATGGAS